MKPQGILFILVSACLLFVESQGRTSREKDSKLQCFRCYYSDCDVPELCTYSGEYLSQIKSSDGERKINITELPLCPASKEGLHNAEFVEGSTTEQAACGKRTIKLFITRFEHPHSSSEHLAAFSPSTEFPLLKPPTTPLTHEFFFTLFGVTDPTSDCDQNKYTELKANKTLESGDVLEFQTVLQSESNCSQCATNLCNNDFITSAAPTVKPPAGDSNTGSGANPISSTKATTGILFIIISLFVMK